LVISNPDSQNDRPHEPDWSLLPKNPYKFFGVSRSDDARTLKRAYGRLIRVYKPEKFPDEFKKIRAAYESLSADIRYGQSSSPTNTSFFDWSKPSESGRDDSNGRDARSGDSQTSDSETGSSEASETQSDSEKAEQKSASDESEFTDQLDCFDFETLEREAMPVGTGDQESLDDPNFSVDLEHRLKDQSLATLRQELEQRNPKTPRDYYQLAVIASAIGGLGHQQKFEGCLLGGIREHSDEMGLLNLLGEYLKKHAPVERLANLLCSSANAVDPTRYFYVTESGWDRLLRERPFEEFKESLHEVERRIGLSADDTQASFYLHILKPAIWKADREWLVEKSEFLEENYQSLLKWEWEQEEFEIVHRLIEYKKLRNQFIDRGKVARAIDKAIQVWCLDSGPEVDGKIVECQYLIAENPGYLLAEFNPKEPLPELIVPWDYIVQDVRSRIGDTVYDTAKTDQHVFEFMVRVERRGNRGVRHGAGILTTMSAVGIALAGLSIAITFLIKLGVQVLRGEILWGMLNFVWAALVIGISAPVAVIMFKIGSKMVELPYDVARKELLKLLRVVPVSTDELEDLLMSTLGMKRDGESSISDADDVADGMRDDPAIEIYSIAQRCINVRSNDELEPL
jgi:hypothetical protein